MSDILQTLSSHPTLRSGETEPGSRCTTPAWGVAEYCFGSEARILGLGAGEGVLDGEDLHA